MPQHIGLKCICSPKCYLIPPFFVCVLSYCFISFHYFTITIFSRYASQVNVGRDGSDLFALCISCCVSALNGSRNKEVVDQAKGGGVNQM